MKQYISPDPWLIIEDGFHPEHQKISESLFSIGNGRMGQRANHEEGYHGETLQGSYLAGVYYPDKTRVGWWKNGYPEYFAKVLNSPNWIEIGLVIDDQPFDLRNWEIRSFRRVLNMQEGLLSRQMEIHKDNLTLRISAQRICHYSQEDCGLVSYSVQVLEGETNLQIASSVDADVRNSDANYDEDFWKDRTSREIQNGLQITCLTRKTNFQATYSMSNHFRHSDGQELTHTSTLQDHCITQHCRCHLKQNESLAIDKFVIVHTSLIVEPNVQIERGNVRLGEILGQGADSLFASHRQAWATKWAESDVQIQGDVSAQQGIRFNMFQLHQTYRGNDTRLNIGPK